MKRVFPLKRTLVGAALAAASLIPVYAFRNLGPADDFAVLAPTINLTGTGTTTVSAVAPGGGAGRVGAVNPINQVDMTADLAATVGPVVGTPEVSAGLTAADTAAQALVAQASAPMAPGVTVEEDEALAGQTFTPGIYYVNNPLVANNLEIATINGTMTLNGAGDYVFVFAGGLSANSAGAVDLINGASAANVLWIVQGGVSLTNTPESFQGKLIAAGDVTIGPDVTVNGKVISTSQITFVDGNTIIDAGSPPDFPAFPADADTSDADYDIEVCVGDPVNYTVTGAEASQDSPGNTTLSIATTPALAALHSPVPPVGPTGTPSTTFSWTPTDADAGEHTIVYRIEGEAPSLPVGAAAPICERTVTIRVSRPPVIEVTSVNGALSGNGTAGNPYELCVGTPFTYTVSADDPDAGDVTALRASNVLAANHTPQITTPLLGDPATSSFSFTPTAAQAGQTFTVTYNAEDELGCDAEPKTVTMVVDTLPAFSAPVASTLATPATQTYNVCVGDTLNVDIRAADPTGTDTLTLSVEDVPLWATHAPNAFGFDTQGAGGGDQLLIGVNTAATRLSWTPTAGDVGQYTLTYHAVDDQCDNDVTLQVVINVSRAAAFNRPPTPADGATLVTCVGEQISYSVSATDPDGNAVTLSATGVPSGLVHASQALNTPGTPTATTTATWTPATAGLYTVVYTATESGAQCTTTTTVNIRVSAVPEFKTPTPADNAMLDVCAGDPITFRVRASDTDTGDIVTLSQSGLPAGAQLTPNLPLGGNPVETVFSWTPGANVAGNFSMTFTAEDEAGCTASRTITLRVSRRPVINASGFNGQIRGTGTQSDPYVLCGPRANGTGASTFTFNVSATDPDGNNVTLSQTGAPAVDNFTPQLPRVAANPTSAFSFTPSAGDVGRSYTVTLNAVDNSTASCPAVPVVIYLRVSAAPTITTTSATVNACVGQTSTFRIRAEDAEAGSVTITQANAPASMMFSPTLPIAGNPVETLATITPVVGDAGTRLITFTATDADGCTAQVQVTLNVSRAPEFSLPTTNNQTLTRTVGIGDPLQYTVAVSDADNDDIELSVGGDVPAGLTHTPELPETDEGSVTVTANFTPTPDQAGSTFTLTYTARDDSPALCTSTVNVVISVIDNKKPQVSITNPAKQPKQTVSGTINIRGTVQDSVGLVRWELYLDEELPTRLVTLKDLSGAKSDTIDVPVDTLQLTDGDHTAILVARDTSGNVERDSVTFTVNNTLLNDRTPPAISIAKPLAACLADEDPEAEGIQVSLAVTVVERNLDPDATKAIDLTIDNQKIPFTAGDVSTNGDARTINKVVTLEEGPHQLRVEARDLAQPNPNTNSATRDFTVDVEVPRALITSPSQGTFANCGDLTVTGVVTDSVGLKRWELLLDTTVVASAEVSGQSADVNTTVSLTPSHRGARKLILRATDACDRVSVNTLVSDNPVGRATVDFTVDNRAPQGEIITPANQTIVSGNALNVTGRFRDADFRIARVELLIDGTVQPNGVKTLGNGLDNHGNGEMVTVNFTVDTTLLTNGEHDIRLRGFDECENEAVAGNLGNGGTQALEVTVKVDNAAPSVTLTNPADGQVITADTFIVRGRVDDAASLASWELKLYRPGAQNSPIVTRRKESGFQSVNSDVVEEAFNTSIAQGEVVIELTATDTTGHSSSTQVTVRLNNNDPSVDITAPSTARGNTTIPVTFTVTDNAGGFVDRVDITGVNIRIIRPTRVVRRNPKTGRREVVIEDRVVEEIPFAAITVPANVDPARVEGDGQDQFRFRIRLSPRIYKRNASYKILVTNVRDQDGNTNPDAVATFTVRFR